MRRRFPVWDAARLCFKMGAASERPAPSLNHLRHRGLYADLLPQRASAREADFC